jgi:sugar lactone lactonase YvrE
MTEARTGRIGVIDGGLCHLAAAYTLAARGYRVVVFEKSPWLGGKGAILEAGVVVLGLCMGLAACGCAPPIAPDAGRKERFLDDKVSYPEGAAYFGGKLYYVGYDDNTVNVWNGKEKRILRELEPHSGPCAVVPVGKDGDVLVACYDSNTLVRLNEKGEPVETIDVTERGGVGPNDFVTDSAGGVYFSASGVFGENEPATGKVFYLDPAGEMQCVAKEIHYSNGLALADDGKSLLVAEMRKGQILKFDVGPDHGLSNRRVWKKLADVRPDPKDMKWFIGPDGLKADSKRNFYICQFGAGRILVIDKDGKWIRTLPVPYKYVTNVALNPAHEDVVFVTAAEDADPDEKDPKRVYGGKVFEIPNR